MIATQRSIAFFALASSVGAAGIANAQLPAPNAGGISTGHIHLTVPDVSEHRALWLDLGGVAKTSGRLELIEFPGIYVLLTEGEPAAASAATSANHFGFSVRDYATYRAKLVAAGASFFYESEDNGQILADLPGGVRIEILTDAEQAEPIAFHHMHLATTDVEGLSQWYVETFAAEAGERRGLPSALVPGGRVDFLPAQADADGNGPRGSRGAAIDHIGFEVADIDAFAARMQQRGIEFDFGPATIDAIGLTIAFLTDPAGTYIEITEGLAHIE